jgi:hypothetical protein
MTNRISNIEQGIANFGVEIAASSAVGGLLAMTLRRYNRLAKAGLLRLDIRLVGFVQEQAVVNLLRQVLLAERIS